MKKCFLFIRCVPPHHTQRFFFPPLWGNRCVSVFTADCRGSDLTPCLGGFGGAEVNTSCVGQSKDTVADNGGFYFPGHMSSLFTTGLTLVDAGLGGQEPHHHHHLTNCTPQHYPCHMVGHNLVATVSMRRSSWQPQSFNLTSLPLSTTPAIRATKDTSDQTARPLRYGMRSLTF